MSSGVDSGGLVAAAVILPVAAAYGAGWLAWQGGKLLVEVGQAVNREVAEKKRELEERARQRKKLAITTHEHLVEMCNSILAELDDDLGKVDAMDFENIEKLKNELRVIVRLEVPEDVERLEGVNLQGFSKLDTIVAKQKGLGQLQINNQSENGYRKYAVADLMSDFKIAIMAADIRETVGSDMCAADPVVLERVKLNDKLMSVVGKIMLALEHVGQLTDEFGLSEASSNWLHSCFNGVDSSILHLSKPTTGNEDLKKGIKRLEGMMEQYEMMIPSIDKTCMQIQTLYQVYVDAAKALGEKIEKRKKFKSVKEIEDRLEELKMRSIRAQECAEIYKKLGPNAYICYAWDQELSALGYTVHSRKEIMELANIKPKHAKIGEANMPFYQWSEKELTQLYSVTDRCDLQVIVHEDGTVSMQTIANGNKATAAEATKVSHCSKLKRLHESLKQNWFLIYDFEEKQPSDKVSSIEEWLSADENGWKSLPRVYSEDYVVDQRQREKVNNRMMQNK